MEFTDYIKSRDWDTAIAKCTIEIKDAEKTTDKEKIGKAYMERGYARCFVLSKNKDYGKAIEDISMALELITADKLEAECYVKRAYAYWLDRNYERAKADCEQVINRSGEENVKAAAHELLGNVHSEEGNTEKAVEHYGEALMVNPMSFSLLDHYREANK